MDTTPHPESSAQRAFAAACLDPETSVPTNVRGMSREQRRFSVYRNNVVVSLLEALAAKFPATQAVVGEDFFREAARIFLRASPPRSPVLWRFGDDFPDFLDAFAPAAALAYLPDLARLEVAVQTAFHAADAAPLTPADLARLAPEAAAHLRLTLHPAAYLVRSTHPVATIWRMNRGAEPLAEITNWTGEDALVTRPELDVRVVALPDGAAAFLDHLSAGQTLGDAAEAALRTPGADLSRILGAVVPAGALLVSPASSETQP